MKIPLEHYPGMNPFVLDWLAGKPEATKFLKRWGAGVLTRARSAHVSPDLLSALDTSNRRWGLFVKNQLQQWAAGETVTLVAGQQVGFAGGPLYTLAKIASLLKMKREIESSGRSATVFFWLATEDHDFEEVARLALGEARGWLEAGVLSDTAEICGCNGVCKGKITKAITDGGLGTLHQRLHALRAGGQPPMVDLVHVGDVDMEEGGDGEPLASRVADHDDRRADAHLRVHDGAAGTVVAPELLGVEDALHERDRLVGAVDDEVGRDFRIAFGFPPHAGHSSSKR